MQPRNIEMILSVLVKMHGPSSYLISRIHVPNSKMERFSLFVLLTNYGSWTYSVCLLAPTARSTWKDHRPLEFLNGSLIPSLNIS